HYCNELSQFCPLIGGAWLKPCASQQKSTCQISKRQKPCWKHNEQAALSLQPLAGFYSEFFNAPKLLVGEQKLVANCCILDDLLRPAGANERRGYARVAKHPRQCELGEGLAAIAGNFSKAAHASVGILGEPFRREGLAGSSCPGIRWNAAEVLAGQQALGQGREHYATHSCLADSINKFRLDPAVENRV